MNILPREDSAYNVMTNVGFHRAQRIVVAAGARSARLLEPLVIRVPLETERGYHVMLPTPNVSLTTTLSNKSRSFGVTPMEHGLRVAGTVEIAGLEAAPDERRAKDLLANIRTMFPEVNPTPTASGGLPSFDTRQPADAGRGDRPAGPASRRRPRPLRHDGRAAKRAPDLAADQWQADSHRRRGLCASTLRLTLAWRARGASSTTQNPDSKTGVCPPQ